jgi:ketosteroid isomerase-like protein
MSIEDAIRDTDARIAEAFNHGGLAAVVTLHSADAILLGPDSSAERGGKGVEEGFKEMLDTRWKNIEFGSV